MLIVLKKHIKDHPLYFLTGNNAYVEFKSFDNPYYEFINNEVVESSITNSSLVTLSNNTIIFNNPENSRDNWNPVILMKYKIKKQPVIQPDEPPVAVVPDEPITPIPLPNEPVTPDLDRPDNDNNIPNSANNPDVLPNTPGRDIYILVDEEKIPIAKVEIMEDGEILIIDKSEKPKGVIIINEDDNEIEIVEIFDQDIPTSTSYHNSNVNKEVIMLPKTGGISSIIVYFIGMSFLALGILIKNKHNM